MKIEKDVKLSKFTTFKIGGKAKFFVSVKNEEDLISAISWARKRAKKIFILGGGSNVLLSDKDYSGLFIKNEIKGIEIVGQNEEYSIVKSYGGEMWSKFVYFSINNNLYGMENLLHIPGTVGASPVQNIGAYGVELKDVFYNLCAINIKTGEKEYFNLKDCKFSYRSSIFKKEGKGKYFILWVEVILKKKKEFNLSYGGVKDKLEEKGIKDPETKDVVDAIWDMRNSKIPNPAVLPNAGSFFKNPVVSSDSFKKLKKEFPDIKGYHDKEEVKIPAAWLIEKCGLKGYRKGDVGVCDKQAIILVNYGRASQKEVLDLANLIKKKVFDKFSINIDFEVNVIK
jgi:UDP-N-acetylmuramate dehydrogenase